MSNKTIRSINIHCGRCNKESRMEEFEIEGNEVNAECPKCGDLGPILTEDGMGFIASDPQEV